ncbi:MAG: hypothetical protein HOO90_03425 [Methylotenera sp.]|uniref:hypothetical protein n=1 Tax=Methylotenera sp. TaxID=2051956 RepID=UPI00185D42C4|nr:hypothetical protein [Methylotenera sp.]NOU24567.1 hypothetical protein [Methylotenera sp.]
MFAIKQQEEAINYRNSKWANIATIPSWVNINEVGLDQFFTQEEVAEFCHDSLLNYLIKEGVDTNDYTFIEPSAGTGSFFKRLPKDKRIGLDIMPLCEGVEQQDFLSWMPNNHGKKYIFVGNPPFGYRAWLSLVFLNHAAQFADYVGFILPMAFQSDGKGSPKNRVKGMTLVHSEIIPSNSFFSPDGKFPKVNALWQIWKKGESIAPERKTCNQWLDLFTVDMRKERLCGMQKLDQADYFLQRTYFKEPPSLVKSFSEVKYVCGYGLIIKKEKDYVVDVLNGIDWFEYSNLAAHNCRHISMYHIEKALTDRGILDVRL